MEVSGHRLYYPKMLHFPAQSLDAEGHIGTPISCSEVGVGVKDHSCSFLGHFRESSLKQTGEEGMMEACSHHELFLSQNGEPTFLLEADSPFLQAKLVTNSGFKDVSESAFWY